MSLVYYLGVLGSVNQANKQNAETDVCEAKTGGRVHSLFFVAPNLDLPCIRVLPAPRAMVIAQGAVGRTEAETPGCLTSWSPVARGRGAQHSRQLLGLTSLGQPTGFRQPHVKLPSIFSSRIFPVCLESSRFLIFVMKAESTQPILSCVSFLALTTQIASPTPTSQLFSPPWRKNQDVSKPAALFELLKRKK